MRGFSPRWYLAVVACGAAVCAGATDRDLESAGPRLLRSRDLPIEIDQALLQRQYDVLTSMQLTRVEYSPLGPIKSVRGRLNITLPRDISARREGDAADDLVPLLRDILLANGSESLTVWQEKVGLKTGGLTFRQTIRGLPVTNGYLAIEYDEISLEASRVVATFLPDRGLPDKPSVTADWARDQALTIVSTRRLGCMPGAVTIVEEPTLGYFVDSTGMNPPRLVWVMHVQPDDEKIYINAVAGTLVRREPQSIPFMPCPRQRE